jgi:hypothetical protein
MPIAALRPLIDEVLPAYPPLEPARRRTVVDAITPLVAEHLEGLPTALRLGVWAAVTSVDAAPLVLTGRRLRALAPAARGALVRAARRAPPAATLLTLVQSVALLHFHEHPLVREALGVPE